ncbi:MAG: hypothetical protein GF375_02950, partial [Candidatus Omnitrophica bacterium]|nr:hypothetical protein [Candidatus Omnitrophota bacterium]
HTLFYEVLAELEKVMRNLQNLADKKSIGRSIFDIKTKPTNGKTNVCQMITPLAVTTHLSADKKEGIIEELVELLVKAGCLAQSEKEVALKDLYEREINMSTGMQDGIALPHAKTKAIDRIICAIGVKKEGADFDSIDGKPSTIFVMILASAESPESYLQFMAEITKFLMSEENRKNVLSAEDNRVLYELFSSHFKT